MYKQKLYGFGLVSASVLIMALACAAIAAHLTRENLQQSTTAQMLLTEHQQLSSISYRLFKQLTDELIFGQNANQAEVRNKQQMIKQSLAKIRQLEVEQRAALGAEITQGSVEDTDELERLIDEIITEFRAIVASNDSTPLRQQSRVQRLLEVTIDNQFRESINAAVMRQGRVVSATNARIDTLNTAIVWFTVSLGVIAFPFIILGCYWLFNQLYHPLTVLRSGTEAIAAGNYQYRLPTTLDKEFVDLVNALNQLAMQLAEHDANEAQSRKRLEIEVDQRTRELTEANHQLTQLDARRRQFIADVSHELRTPLTIIRGEAQVTLRQSNAAEHTYRETLQAILDQAVGLSRLVDDLLLLARAEMSQLNLERAQHNVLSIAHQQWQQWQRLHPERHFHYRVEPATESTFAWVDEQRLHQALAILLDNSVKYSAPNTDIELNIKIDAERVKFVVTDHGEGISPADLDHIFERFVRFKSRSEGAGLGLSIARAIIEAHGGEISAHSTMGVGSSFTLTLPLDYKV